MANNDIFREQLRDAKVIAEKSLDKCNSLDHEIKLLLFKFKVLVWVVVVILLLAMSKDSILMDVVKKVFPSILK